MMQDSIFNKFHADLTIILDMDVNKCLKRIKKRKTGMQKYEKMDISFHKKVRKGFLEIFKKNKKRCVILEADEDENIINDKILKIINDKFKIIF